MAFKTSSFDTTAAPYYSSSVWTLDELAMGYKLEGTMGVHQVSMSGLDGGSFTVHIRLPGDPTFKEHTTSAADETDTVMIKDPLINAIKVTASSMGGSAAPIVHVTSLPRGFSG